MNLVHVEKAEIPPAGWFHDHVMETLLGKELAEIMKYPKTGKNKS